MADPQLERLSNRLAPNRFLVVVEGVPTAGQILSWDNTKQCFVPGAAGGAGDFKADGSVPMTGDLNMGGKKVTAALDVVATGDVKAATFHVGAAAGVDGTITATSTVTVVKGIVTAIVG